MKCWFYFEFGTATEAVISVSYTLRPKRNFFNRFSVLYEVGSVAEETIEYHPLSIANLPQDISRL